MEDTQYTAGWMKATKTKKDRPWQVRPSDQTKHILDGDIYMLRIPAPAHGATATYTFVGDAHRLRVLRVQTEAKKALDQGHLVLPVGPDKTPGYHSCNGDYRRLKWLDLDTEAVRENFDVWFKDSEAWGLAPQPTTDTLKDGTVVTRSPFVLDFDLKEFLTREEEDAGLKEVDPDEWPEATFELAHEHMLDAIQKLNQLLNNAGLRGLNDTFCVQTQNYGRHYHFISTTAKTRKEFNLRHFTIEGYDHKFGEVVREGHQGIGIGSAGPSGRTYKCIQDKLPQHVDWYAVDALLLDASAGAIAARKRATQNTAGLSKVVPISRARQSSRTDDIGLARQALSLLGPEFYDGSYDDWLHVGMALHSVDDSLLVDWDNWSKQSPKYKEGECASKWQGFEQGGGYTIGSLLHWAGLTRQTSGLAIRAGGTGTRVEGRRASRKVNAGEMYEFVENTYGGRLRYNLMSQMVELDGQPKALDHMYLEIDKEHGVLGSKEAAKDACALVANNNEYHPWTEELLRIERDDSIEPLAEFHALGAKLFGKPDESDLRDVYLVKLLVSAVARALDPGCKVDTALILTGGQGIGKTTFFQELFGSTFFDTYAGKVKDGSDGKDSVLQFHRAACVEWGEMDNVYKAGSSCETVKAFLSKCKDVVRRPYATAHEVLQRRFVIVGTTNKDQFLVDGTGNRRFWVVPVLRKVDVQWVRENREAIWKAAILGYRSHESYTDGQLHLSSPYQWWLTDDQQDESNRLNQEHTEVDLWEEVLAPYLSSQSYVTKKELFDGPLSEYCTNPKKPEEDRLGNVLRHLGWVSKTKYLSRRNKRVWVPQNS